MKNRLLVILLVIAAFSLAGIVVSADLTKGNYRPTDLGSIQQPQPAELSDDSVYQVAAYTVSALELAPGDGRQLVQIYCNTCHSPRYISMQPPLPAAAWEAEVNKMNKTFGAGIPDDESQKIIRYLQAHYTPETRKQ